MASTKSSGGQSKRGFASMDEDKQREIASKGGKAAHEKGTESNKTAAAKPSNIVSRVYRHANFDLFYVAAH